MVLTDTIGIETRLQIQEPSLHFEKYICLAETIPSLFNITRLREQLPGLSLCNKVKIHELLRASYE